jgi:hypothetical protein
LSTARHKRHIDDFVARLTAAAGPKLKSVVLYGASAHGDHYMNSDDYLLIVVKSLDLDTLRAIGEPVRRWLKGGHPVPRLFSPPLIAEASDVFPIEFLDIAANHVLLYGENPFAALKIDRTHLRIQCERELREKMMRLREAFVQANDRAPAIRRLLAESFNNFVTAFRGCLHLSGEPVPVHNSDVIAAFCQMAKIDPEPFQQVEQLKAGAATGPDPLLLFSHYYAELSNAVGAIDCFEEAPKKGVTAQ